MYRKGSMATYIGTRQYPIPRYHQRSDAQRTKFPFMPQHQRFKPWSSLTHLLTHVVLARVACGSNIPRNTVLRAAPPDCLIPWSPAAIGMAHMSSCWGDAHVACTHITTVTWGQSFTRITCATQRLRGNFGVKVRNSVACARFLAGVHTNDCS